MLYKNIPFVDLKAQYLTIKEEIDQAVSDVFNHAKFIQGEEVEQFEEEFAKFLGAKYCVSVNSGTDALILGVRVLNLFPGEILIPANTYISTALAASENGLKPVFVDIDENDFGINLSDLKKKINSRTRAIIIVHLYGQPEKMEEINEIIKLSGKKIYLIEDACQAHGAEYKGIKVGNFGVFAAFSFYPGKNLGAYGDGGALVTNSSQITGKIKLLREYGQKKKYYHETVGVNSRLDTLQAAILRVKLKHLNFWNRKRRQTAAIYTQLINSEIPEIKTPKIFPGRNSVFHLYVVRSSKRDLLLNYLNEAKIQTLIHYPIPLHLQKAFKSLGYQKGDLPIVEKVVSEILSLPLYPELTEKKQEFIVEEIKKCVKMR